MGTNAPLLNILKVHQVSNDTQDSQWIVEPGKTYWYWSSTFRDRQKEVYGEPFSYASEYAMEEQEPEEELNNHKENNTDKKVERAGRGLIPMSMSR